MAQKIDKQMLVTETDHQDNSDNITISSSSINADQRPKESPEVGDQTEAVRQNLQGSDQAEPSTHSSVTSEQQRQGESSDEGQGQSPRLNSKIQSIRDVPVEDAVQEKLKDITELNIVVVGCFSMGKSTLINSLFFERGKKYKKEAKEGSSGPCTTRKTAKKPYVLEIKGINYNIYDSPGLQDGSQEDLELLEWISERHDKIHLVIYCTRMDEPIRPSEIEAMNNVTTAFKKSIWNNTVFALTFANKVEPSDPEVEEDEYFEEVSKGQAKELNNIFISKLSLPEATIKKIEKNIFPAGSARKLQLPGRSHDWRVDFWRGCLDACDPEGKEALFELYKTRDYINMSTASASVSTASGAIAIIGGVGSMIAGTALTATGILAPVGVPLIVGGGVSTVLGVAATAGGAGGIHANIKAKKEEKERKKRAAEKARK